MGFRFYAASGPITSVSCMSAACCSTWPAPPPTPWRRPDDTCSPTRCRRRCRTRGCAHRPRELTSRAKRLPDASKRAVFPVKCRCQIPLSNPPDRATIAPMLGRPWQFFAPARGASSLHAVKEMLNPQARRFVLIPEPSVSPPTEQPRLSLAGVESLRVHPAVAAIIEEE